MAIGSKKPEGARYGDKSSKAQKATGANADAYTKSNPAGKASGDEFGTRKVPAPSNKRKQGPTTKNYESKPEGGRQWGMPGKG
jgi:hypothetical protein